MGDRNFKYEPLSETELQGLWKKHKSVIESFIAYNEYSIENVYVDEKRVMAIIAKIDQRKKYFQYFHGLDMSECKEAALVCFWYIKLQPICAVSKNILQEDMKVFDSLNEKLAVYYIIVTLKGMLERQKMSVERVEELPDKYIKELIYSFTYRDISKEALILLVESMAVFLGLNPYKR